MQTDAAGSKAFRFGVVLSENVTHQLGHNVLVIPRRSKRVLLWQPAWWKDHKVNICGAFFGCGGCKHREDRRVGVIERDRANGRIVPQVVFVRRIITMPGNHVQRGMINLGTMKLAAPFDRHAAARVAVFEPGDRSFEIARVGQAVRADRTAAGQREFCAVVFANESACLIVQQVNFENHSSRQNAYFKRFKFDLAELGKDRQPARLRNDQQFRIRVVKKLVIHTLVGQVNVSRHPKLRADIAGGRHRSHAGDKGDLLLRERRRIPTILP